VHQIATTNLFKYRQLVAATRTVVFLGIPRLAFCHRQRQKKGIFFCRQRRGSGGCGTHDNRSRKSDSNETDFPDNASLESIAGNFLDPRQRVLLPRDSKEKRFRCCGWRAPWQNRRKQFGTICSP